MRNNNHMNRMTGRAGFEVRAVYAIAVAAELSGLHPQTLRTYERRGLLRPARTNGGTRRFSDEDVNLACRIAQLSADGFSLQAIETVLLLEEKLRELHDENVRLREQLAAATQTSEVAPAGDVDRRPDHGDGDPRSGDESVT